MGEMGEDGCATGVGRDETRGGREWETRWLSNMETGTIKC